MQPEIVLLCISSLFMVPQEGQAFGIRLKVFEVFNITHRNELNMASQTWLWRKRLF